MTGITRNGVIKHGGPLIPEPSDGVYMFLPQEIGGTVPLGQHHRVGGLNPSEKYESQLG